MVFHKDPSEELKNGALATWNQMLDHAFVRRLADGTLERECFQLFVAQDYVFLTEYARAVALCAARSPDITTMRYFAELLSDTVTKEVASYESYAETLGLSVDELARQQLTGPIRNYAVFLIETASKGLFGGSIAALLPCVWGYAEMGQNLVARGIDQTSMYAGWLEAYAAPELAALADSFRCVVNRYLKNSNEDEWVSARDAFSKSCLFELEVWDAALSCGVSNGSSTTASD